MVDIHSHLLHRFDDGPKDLASSIALIREMASTGVTEAVATSHYYSAHLALEEFLNYRSKRLEELKAALREEGIPIRLYHGAEVYIDKILLNLGSLKELCIENTNYILLEIPHGEKRLEDALSLIERIMSYYYVKPIIAHVERYDFFSKKIKNLRYLKDMGCLVQMDANCLTESYFNRRVGLAALEAGYIDIIASDCHDLQKRKPNLADAYAVIHKKLGASAVEVLKQNAKQLIY